MDCLLPTHEHRSYNQLTPDIQEPHDLATDRKDIAQPLQMQGNLRRLTNRETMTSPHPPVPTVSCIVPTTKNRCLFWPMLFRCFQAQSWPNRELVLVSEDPIDGELPPKTRVIKVSPGTSIGSKINIGVENSHSDYFCKMDDDDWYHRYHLSGSISPLLRRTPSISMATNYMILLLKPWELHYLPRTSCAGGTICFDRAAWNLRHFEDRSASEDWNFINLRSFPILTPMSQVLVTYVIVRHENNTWNDWQETKTPVDNALIKLGKKQSMGPEGFFSPEDLAFYQKLRLSLHY